MITGVIKSKVDKIWNDMAAGGIVNPLTVIEQLTCLKRLDELHTLKASGSAWLGSIIRGLIFTSLSG